MIELSVILAGALIAAAIVIAALIVSGRIFAQVEPQPIIAVEQSAAPAPARVVHLSDAAANALRHLSEEHDEEKLLNRGFR